MRSCDTSFRAALLGSALALAALTPAAGANISRADAIRAAMGDHSSALWPKSRPATAVKAASAQVQPAYAVLHDFAGAPNDGAGSGAEVSLDSLGNVYGTTDYGGSGGWGTIFKLAPDGTETILHSFDGAAGGSTPDGAVHIIRSSGDLYGTTISGGSSGNGIIYKLAADGTYTVLYNLDGTNDGTFARGRLIRDAAGTGLYGTALFGGTSGDGTVFKYGFDGKFTVLHTFDGTDGEFPEHGLTRDSAGNFYGVTAFGGSGGQGTVFKIAPDGTFTTLYNFTGGTADGGFLYGTVDSDKDGNLYGSTVDGGAHGYGTVFKLAPDGTLTTLYNFTGGTDGGGPEGDMLKAGKNLFSTSTSGGDPSCQCGTIYEVNIATGIEKVLHAFTSADGGGYAAGLVKQKGTRVFYGTTQSYGAHGNGVVFSVTK